MKLRTFNIHFFFEGVNSNAIVQKNDSNEIFRYWIRITPIENQNLFDGKEVVQITFPSYKVNSSGFYYPVMPVEPGSKIPSLTDDQFGSLVLDLSLAIGKHESNCPHQSGIIKNCTPKFELGDTVCKIDGSVNQGRAMPVLDTDGEMVCCHWSDKTYEKVRWFNEDELVIVKKVDGGFKREGEI